MTGEYKPADIAKFVSEIEPYLDPSSLEVAWELLSEDGETTDPAGLAEILFSDTSAPLCYAAYCLLSEDKLYFKQKGDRYEPRSKAQIVEIQHQQQVAAVKQEEWQQYLQRIEQALAGKSVEWQESDRPRLEAIERFATFAEEA
ncbi:MAG: RNB domain-containing ribonuclease, partial [Leptolyngbyaceae cyanobacterium SM1_3_5]|nr:RNB domain-containing ribonuclease [Leptolyngbyaceae cyanobacterium SM1_3_5]